MPRLWTDQQRQDASARACAQHPWLHATGPRTALGKRISSRNSHKHGRFTFDKQVLRWYVRLAALRVKQVKAACFAQTQKFQNELIARGHMTSLKKPNIMGFYPYFKVHPLDFRDKAPKKPRNVNLFTNFGESDA